MHSSHIVLRAFLSRHGRSLSLYGGLSIVAVWTVLRHITNGVNFDIVGQVGMAEQWTLGQHAGAQIGSTNYLLKMPLYWLVNHLGFLSPHAKLLILALACNILTFVVIFIVIEKILDLYKVGGRAWFYLGFLWLASVSGNTYWLEYANSRNLETAGGLLILYVTLLVIERFSYKKLWLLASCAGIVFFADPLQVYVIGLPLCLYAFVAGLRERSREGLVERSTFVGAFAVGYVLSKVLFWTAGTLLPVSFLKIPGTVPKLDYANLSATFHAVITNTLKVFGADFAKPPYGFNSVRSFLGFVTLAGIMILVIKLMLQHKADDKPRGLVLTVLAVNFLVYVGSGQALQWETARYLVMVPLISLVLISLYADELATWQPRRLKLAWIVVTAACSVLVLGALVKSWPTRYSRDVGIADTVSFVQSHAYGYGFTSRQLAIPASYFDSYRHTLLPLICGNDHQVQFSNLFFDNAPLAKLHSEVFIPIIIPSGGIVSDNNTCSTDNVLAQLGSPAQELAGPDSSTVFVYPSQALAVHKL